MLATFATFINQRLSDGQSRDSKKMLNTLMGTDPKGREDLIVQGGALALIYKDWKYIQINDGDAIQVRTGIETGNAPQPQLYNLKIDPAETNNLAAREPGRLKEMEQKLKKIVE